MKRVVTATCLAMLCAGGLAAQTPADDQKRKGSDAAKMDEKTVTLTGCLRAGDTPNSFVLANVKTAEATATKVPTAPTAPMPATPPTEPPSTPPTPTTPPVPATPPATPQKGAPIGTSGAGSGDVRLVGAPANMDLSKHVGHTVEITGTFAPAGKATRPTGTSGTAGAPASDVRSFNVKSMAHKSETCK